MDYYDHNEDRLERAIAAMRDVPQLGDVPASEILDKIAASRDATPRQPLWIVKRIRNMKPVSKIAASVLLFIGLMSLVVLLTHGNSAMAFETVAQQLNKASTMTADMTIAAAGQTMSGKIYFRTPGQFRSELGGSGISIVDTVAHRMLTLDPAHKLAFVFNMQGKDTSGKNPVDFIEKLRNVSRDAGKPLGEAEIDGVRAKQFNVTSDGQPFVIWADAKTGAPLRVDLSQTVGNTHTTMTLDHIKLDAPIDEHLFSTIVPEGYTVQDLPVNMSEPSEADVPALLKDFADASGGEFPATVRDFKIMFQPLFQKTAQVKGGKPDPKMLNLVMQAGRAVAFISKLPKTSDWHYAGKGKKLGDASQPVFWYVPAGASQYRVIYGDLHASEAAAGDVPQDSAAETQTTNP